MNYYDRYKDLLGVPYDDGDHDCYGLCRRYYKLNYNLDLPNYARSNAFFDRRLDLIAKFLRDTDFTLIDAPTDRLDVGDGLLLAVPSRGSEFGQVNHLGVYVGNQTFLHHMYTGTSSDDALTDRWRTRIMGVVRSPTVTLVNVQAVSRSAVDILSLVPEHVKQKFIP